jgi:hypothetical protein
MRHPALWGFAVGTVLGGGMVGAFLVQAHRELGDARRTIEVHRLVEGDFWRPTGISRMNWERAARLNCARLQASGAGDCEPVPPIGTKLEHEDAFWTAIQRAERAGR